MKYTHALHSHSILKCKKENENIEKIYQLMIVNLNKWKSINIQNLRAPPFQLGVFIQNNKKKKWKKCKHILNNKQKSNDYLLKRENNNELYNLSIIQYMFMNCKFQPISI